MRKTNLLGLATMFLLLALGSVPAGGAASEPVCTPEGCSVPQNGRTDARLPAYNDYALFIAGLSNPGSTLAASENQTAWVRHARFFDQNWERFTRGRLAPMREWAAQELKSAQTATVFYPFSGPDFVNVFALFPRAQTYLLIALEPVGEIPDFSAGQNQNFFASLQRSLYDLLQLDFFKTNQMKSSIGKSELKGTLPVLLFFLAREQARVLDVQYWVMQPDGSINESPALGPRDRPAGIPGVRIVFTSPGSTENQTLYYFQFNLGQRFLGPQPAVCRFSEKLRPSHDLHQSRFLFDVQAALFCHPAVYSGSEPLCAARRFGHPPAVLRPCRMGSPVLRDLHLPHQSLQQLPPGGYGRYV